MLLFIMFLCLLLDKLTTWLMGPEGSMPHSRGLSNNPYHDPNQPNRCIDIYSCLK